MTMSSCICWNNGILPAPWTVCTHLFPAVTWWSDEVSLVSSPFLFPISFFNLVCFHHFLFLTLLYNSALYKSLLSSCRPPLSRSLPEDIYEAEIPIDYNILSFRQCIKSWFPIPGFFLIFGICICRAAQRFKPVHISPIMKNRLRITNDPGLFFIACLT